LNQLSKPIRILWITGRRITEEELLEKLCTLQPKKACGADGILNEMIKYTDHKFKLAILKLFNIILTAGIFPRYLEPGIDHTNL
jgi:hypothetical protein